MNLPAHETRIAPLRSRLDEFAPAYQFHESHATHVEATPAQTFRAIRALTADEILLFRALTSIRRFGRAGPESILNAPEKQPLLDVATRAVVTRRSELLSLRRLLEGQRRGRSRGEHLGHAVDGSPKATSSWTSTAPGSRPRR